MIKGISIASDTSNSNNIDLTSNVTNFISTKSKLPT